MRQVKKHTGIFFLWLAGIILVAHSVIPHHHHFEFSSNDEICHQECNHSDDDDHSDKKEFSECFTKHNGQEQQTCNACEFNTKTTSALSKLSVDVPNYIALNPQINLFTSDLNTVYSERTNRYSQFYCKTATLRGPPSLG